MTLTPLWIAEEVRRDLDAPLDRIGMPSAFRGSSFPEGLTLLELAPLALRSVPAEFGSYLICADHPTHRPLPLRIRIRKGTVVAEHGLDHGCVVHIPA